MAEALPPRTASRPRRRVVESRKPRPTQQARSAVTRRKLLSAAVSSLVELGYAGTSTTEVGRRAGVSQGALFKHFGSKTALFVATVEHLFEDLVVDYRRAFAEIADHGDRIGAAVQLLWRTFERPKLQAAFELYIASRCDPELRGAIRPVLLAHRENLRREARALFPDAARRRDDFDAIVDAVLDVMQGAAIGSLVLSEPEARGRELAWLEQITRRELGGESAPDA